MIHRRFQIAAYILAFIAVVDQMSKWWLVTHVMTPPPHPIYINAFLNLVLVWNKGVTFGLLSRFGEGAVPWILVGIAVVILGLLGRWLWRTSSTLVASALGLVMGGAVGNVIDRVRYGAVVDFLDFHLDGWHWYSFNLADSAIVVGVALLLLDGLVRGR